VHPYLLETLTCDHRRDLQRMARPRRSTRPLASPFDPACLPAARCRSLVARLLHAVHVHTAPAPAAR
jgi:hypothetical protein